MPFVSKPSNLVNPLDPLKPIESLAQTNPAQMSQVWVPYCSGDMHAGQRINATNETFGLYFSGYHTLMATVDYLSKHHLGQPPMQLTGHSFDDISATAATPAISAPGTHSATFDDKLSMVWTYSKQSVTITATLKGKAW